MSLWPAAEAASATGGVAHGAWEATGVSIDTRTLRPGDLFVALKDVRDGHDFVAEALDKGAAAAMVGHLPNGVDPSAPLLIVDDVLDGLTALGRAGRARSGARVVAVTGSVGKTSTKEMLRTALAGQGRVHAAEASYNNHWGVPLTLARLPRDADFAVIEVGMNHPGEIAPLARLARPHVAMITTIAPAHLAAFADIDAIAREKAAIFDGLEADGTAIIRGDLTTTPILEEAARRAGARIVRFGEGPDNHHRLTHVELTRDLTVAEGRAWRTKFLFKIGTAGRHFAVNAMGVFAAVSALGADRALAAVALAAWAPPDGRGRRETIVLDIVEDHLTIDLLDDAFNANPASMAAALDTLGAAKTRDNVGRIVRGRRIAVLGDMLELGPDETSLHAALARHPAMERVAKVHCVGPRMRALHQALPEDRRGEWSEEAGEIARRVHELFDAGDVVLVKGSKASRVSLVVDAIRKLGHPAPDHMTGAE